MYIIEILRVKYRKLTQKNLMREIFLVNSENFKMLKSPKIVTESKVTPKQI